MKGGFLLVLLVTATPCLGVMSSGYRLPYPYGWTCIDERCIKQENNGTNQSLMSFSTCKLTCGRYGGLWPKPTGYTTIKNKTVNFDLSKLTLEDVAAPTPDVENLLNGAFETFKNNIASLLPEEEDLGSQRRLFPMEETMQWTIFVRIRVLNTGTATRLSLSTNEAYVLSINTNNENLHTNITINSPTFFGARHALETLSQLIAYDDSKGELEIVSSVGVVDKPVFRYRGILLDTSRNFISVKALERTLDAMAANKLNTFHWHITDTSSFPLFLESMPDMVYYGAYSKKHVYKSVDIQHLVEYGRVRGIRVLPEFAAPGRTGNGWQWTEAKGLGKLALCFEEEPWQSYCSEPPCGQLNIVNENTTEIISQIYKDMINVFGPLDVFHFGGDGVNLNCWNSTEEILTYMSMNEMNQSTESFLSLWKDFQSKAYDNFTAANEGQEIPGILWTSQLTNSDQADMYLDPSKYIIQVKNGRDDAHLGELLRKGFRIILSNQDSWLLNCGFGSRLEKDSVCGAYKGWQTVYDNSPHNIAQTQSGSTHRNLILGGEAILWSHQVDDASVDIKLWPRGAALAERLWTNPKHNWMKAETRFIHQRQRMFQRGIQADRVQSQWCYQNGGFCNAE